MVNFFNESIYEFLKGYAPKNRMFTSEEEICLIADKLNLSNLTYEESVNTRNEVVRFYDNLMDAEIIYNEHGEYKGRTDKFWELVNSMNSVTTVIDYYKFKF